MGTWGISVWEIHAGSVRLPHPASRAPRISAPAVPTTLPIPTTLQQPNSAGMLLGSPQPSPGHCRLLSPVSLPAAPWTGLLGSLPTPFPIPPWLWFRRCLFLYLDQSISWAWTHGGQPGASAPFGGPRGVHLSPPAPAADLASTRFSAGHLGTLVCCEPLAGCVLVPYRRD